MHNTSAFHQSFGLRLAILWPAVLLLCSFAWGQSAEEVHVSPLNGSHDGPPVQSASSADGTRPLYVNSKPFRADVDVVLVPVTVTDTLNHPVLNLEKQDFALYEQDKLQEIQYFSKEQAPLSIALLLDVSKSMSDKVDAERAAITEFVNSANPDDEYFAIAFADRPRLLADSTHSAEEMERKLVAAERGGATAMLDAIYLAVSKLRSARYQRRAIVIISDGGDNASRYTLKEIKNLVEESDLQIYAVGLFDKFFFRTIEEKLGKKWLSEITDPTGGRTITVDNERKVPEAAAQISWELRNEYVLGYRTSREGIHGWRKIRVGLTSSEKKQSLRAYYRRGYLAPGE